MTIDEQFEKLENTVREYNPGADFKRIRESYEFAKLHHGEQRRKSGELYITHPLAVAQIVAEELHLDSESIEAALLHDVIEDTDATYDDVAKLTSPTVADLVEGVSKLTRIQYATKEDEQMENLRKMLIASSAAYPAGVRWGRRSPWSPEISASAWRESDTPWSAYCGAGRRS